MKILIVDDEAPARQRLRRLVESLEGHEINAEASTGIEALRLNVEFKPDLILLDIRMPDMDGMQVARELSNTQPCPAIVFTTAYDQFAVAAFETNARHYLLKPVRKEKLREAIERVALTLKEEAAPGFHPDKQIRIFHHGMIKLVSIVDVLYFKADQKYTEVRTRTDSYLIDDSLLQLEEQYSGLFIRVHRGALVNKNEIAALEQIGGGGHAVRFSDLDESVEVSRRHLPVVRALFKPIENP